MKLCFVSTINQKLYDEYGKRFIKEFMEKSEQNIHYIYILKEMFQIIYKLNIKKILLFKYLIILDIKIF